MTNFILHHANEYSIIATQLRRVCNLFKEKGHAFLKIYFMRFFNSFPEIKYKNEVSSRFVKLSLNSTFEASLTNYGLVFRIVNCTDVAKSRRLSFKRLNQSYDAHNSWKENSQLRACMMP